MGSVRVHTIIGRPPAEVWQSVRAIATHVDWMTDAVAIRFTSPQHEGVGTTFECDTKVGPLRLSDRMVVTEWIDEQVLGVHHTGLVTGAGRFTLRAVGRGRTELSWTEALRFPWWLGGPLAAAAAAPVLRAVWRRNLQALAEALTPAPTGSAVSR